MRPCIVFRIPNFESHFMLVFFRRLTAALVAMQVNVLVLTFSVQKRLR